MGELETISCNFCKSTSYVPYDKLGDFQIVQCSHCNFVYTNPRPTIASLPHYYSEEYYKDKRHYAKFYHEDGSPKSEEGSYPNRIEDVEGFVTKRGKLLEIGSARGGFLKVMKQRGWEVQGIEISEDASKIANEALIPTFTGIFNNFDGEHGFDVIAMYQTLEHVPDPFETIKKSFSLLNKNGVIVIEVPNLNCFEMRYSKKRKALSYDLPRHLNHFTPQFLAKQLEDAGFTIKIIKKYSPKFWDSILQCWYGKGAALINESNGLENNPAEVPLALTPQGLMGKITHVVTAIFPGWRFTIIAEKNQVP